MKGYVDLHCHSSFSDGSKTVEQLVDDAIIKGVRFLSITDHDDVRSIKELKSLKERNIVLIAGVEFSTTLTLNGKSYDMHLLGYGFDEDNDEVTKIMQHYRDNRFQENMNFFGKISELDMDIPDCLCNIKLENYNDILKEIRMALHKSNYNPDYISDFTSKIKGFVPSYDGYEIDTLYAIGAIINAGGVAVLAHPAQIKANDKELSEIIDYLSNNGIIGIEVYHSEATENQMRSYLALSQRFKLFVSVGSDYHYDGEDNKVLGHGINNNLCLTECSLLDCLINRKLIIDVNEKGGSKLYEKQIY